MNNKKILLNAGKAGCVLNAVLLLTLTGCVGYVDGPRAGVYVAPPVVEVTAPADYVYYPGYDVYFNSSAHEFAYMDGGVWVSRPNFPGVSVDVLLASPSVRMDFHDSPANHSAEMARRYPRSAAPSRAGQDRRTDGEKPEVRTEKPEARKAQVAKAEVKKAPAQKAGQKPEKRDEHESK